MSAESSSLVPCSLCAGQFDVQTVISVGGYPLCKDCVERVSSEVVLKKRRFYKINEGKYIAGVCGGLADYANMDRDVFRTLFFLALCVTGGIPFTIVYVILAFVLPIEP